AWDAAADRALLLTRADGEGVLTAVQASGLTELARFAATAPDGLLVTEDGVVLAGAGPTPGAWRWRDDAPEEALPVPEGLFDRLRPRWAGPEGVALVGLEVAGERIWWLGEAAVAGPLGARILGPVDHEGGVLAVVDGVPWQGAPGALSAGTGT